MRRSARLVVAVLAAALLSVPTVLAGTASGAASSKVGEVVDVASGRFLVGFERSAPPPTVDGTLAGLPVLRVAPAAGFLVVTAPGLTAVQDALRHVAGITYVEPDMAMRALATPNDPRYGTQYGPPMMGLPAAWDAVGYGSATVKVAVIDSGIRRTHEDFTPSRILQGYDFVGGDNDPNDTCGHGTHVSGTVAASTANGLGVAGVSQATILPLKGLDAVGGLFSVQCTGSTAGIAEAIVAAADQGADVISMSIGGGSSTTLANAVTYAWGKGVTLVAAAGNDGGSNSIDYPGAYPEVIAVAALDPNKGRASYSDGGPQLDIAAPGSDVISTFNANNSSYSSLSGTSMATPHVSGALALALSCAPTATNVQLRDALYRTAEDLGAGGWDSSFGHGLARADRLVADLCGGGTGPTPEPEPTPTPTDPDPATPTVTSGQVTTMTVSASSADQFVKIAVPAGASRLQVVMDGPNCSLLSCALDADLSTRAGARPTDTVFACSPQSSNSDETCAHSAPGSGYWYLRVKRYSGSGTVTLKATVS